MTEQESSGGSAPVADKSAPAHTAGTAAAFSDATTASAFGATRGSGLARGKRNAPKSAQADAEPRVEYKPTSIELITPQREYSNPFASETLADVPVETPAPTQAVAFKAPAPVAAAVQVAVEPTPEPVAFQAAPVVTAPAEKSEIKILPPEETKRTAVSWDSSSAPLQDEQPRRDQRPVFRPEPRGEQPRADQPRSLEPRRDERQPNDRPRDDRPRNDRPRNDRPRDDRPHDDRPREERAQFDRPRDQRSDGRRDGPREPRNDFRRDRPVEATAPQVAPKSGGFIAWLKGLFGKKPEVTEAPRQEGQNRHGGRGGQGNRHGGRGRGGDNRPYNRGNQGQGQGQSQGQGQNGYQQDDSESGREGGPRRRRRGRGRGRGGYQGGQEPEGHQGGGAI